MKWRLPLFPCFMCTLCKVILPCCDRVWLIFVLFSRNSRAAPGFHLILLFQPESSQYRARIEDFSVVSSVVGLGDLLRFFSCFCVVCCAGWLPAWSRGVKVNSKIVQVVHDEYILSADENPRGKSVICLIAGPCRLGPSECWLENIFSVAGRPTPIQLEQFRSAFLD